MSKFLEEFDVEEKPFSYLAEQYPNLVIKNKILERLDTDQQILFCSDNTQIQYNKLCVCTGARPKVSKYIIIVLFNFIVFQLLSSNNPHVLGIRDTETVQSFQQKLSSAKQIFIVGNGGIATELVYLLSRLFLLRH